MQEQKLLNDIKCELTGIREELKLINKYNYTFSWVQGAILGLIFAMGYVICNT